MYSYTFYCVLVICCSQVFSTELPDDAFDKHALACMEKIKVSKEDVAKFFDENFHVVKGNPKVNEMFTCAIKEKNLLNEDGTMNRESIYKDVLNIVIPWMNKTGDRVAIANKVTDDCIRVAGDTIEDRLGNMHNCLVDGIKNYKN